MSRIAFVGSVGLDGAQLVKQAAKVGAVALTLSLGACAQGNNLGLGLLNDGSQSVDIATASAGPQTQAELEKATAYWGKKSAENPRDGKAALAYARNLKALGRKKMAFSTLQGAYMFNSNDREFLSEYGRLALEYGQISTADALLTRAEDPAKPDWRVISARGTVRAKQGRYKEAIELFERARSLEPQRASLANNLAMAYTLNGEAERGEQLLREAEQLGSKDKRIAENLALVMDLQGKPKGASPAMGSAADPSAAPQLRPSQGFGHGSVAKAALPPPVTTASASGSMDADAIIRAAMEAERTRGTTR
ncbi:MAG: tetratricopeptide repeat protein [Hyphomicrobiaceae bacterium]